MTDRLSMDQIKSGSKYDLLSMYEHSDEILDSPFQYSSNKCDYLEPKHFVNYINDINDPLSYFHLNCKGLSANWESFHNLIYDLQCEKLHLIS